MADLKISQLLEETTPQNADVFAIAVDLASTPATKKITLANLITAINKPAGVSGNVQFNNAGAFGGDNGLYWDNVNKRLGIGTTGPGEKLEVAGNIKISDDSKLTNAAGAYVQLFGGADPDVDIYAPTNGEIDLIAGVVTTSAGLTVGSSVTVTNEIEVATSAVGDPGYTFTGDGDTGMYSPSADKLGLVTGGTARLYISDGNVGIGTVSPTISDGIGLHLAGKILRIGTAKTPATAGAAGNAGEICWDANFLYCCVDTNTWKKVAIATW